MRPVLVALGPWNYSALPVIFAVLYAIMLGWQWVEWRFAEGKKLDAMRFAVTAIPAAVLSLAAFWGVNKVAPLEIKAWGTMLVVAFTAGGTLMALRADRKVIEPAEAVDLCLYILVGAIIGARVIFIALDWGTYAGHFGKLFNVWEGGLSFHGGLLGAIISGLIFAHRRHKSFWAIADETTPSIALGYCFARIGCFLNGCCHGSPCTLPWAVRFPHGELPNVPVHPTQLYAVGLTAIIFLILSQLRGKVRRPGHLFGIYLALYSIERFFLEFTRAGVTGKYVIPGFWMTDGQAVSIFLIAVAVVALALTWKLPVPAATPAPPPSEKPRNAGKRR